MSIDYCHQRTKTVSAKACIGALDVINCSKTAVKGSMPSACARRRRKFFAFVQTIPPPGGVGGSQTLADKDSFTGFLADGSPMVQDVDCGCSS